MLEGELLASARAPRSRRGQEQYPLVDCEIAVLLPARNAADTIETAVRSTLVALTSRDRLHVWDDASSDGTPEALARIKDRRLVVHRGDVRLGVAGALAALLATSESVLVGRMDADDRCLPHRFALQRSLIGDADAVFTGAVTHEHGRYRTSLGQALGMAPETVRLWLSMENPLLHPTMLARRSAVAAAGGWRASLAEDYDLWLRLAARGSALRRLRVPSLVYARHPRQISSGAYFRRAAEDRAINESWHLLLTTLGLRYEGTFADHHAHVTRVTHPEAFEATITHGLATEHAHLMTELRARGQRLRFDQRWLFLRRLSTLRAGSAEH